jgi:hypothetical protein
LTGYLLDLFVSVRAHPGSLLLRARGLAEASHLCLG